jgi:RNA polymerase sigma-70 factor (ECF subfamily)
MLLQHSRRETRVDEHGDLVTLEDQDRSRWDHAAIAEGLALLDPAGDYYQLQAAIAAVHASAADAGSTDFVSLAYLYARLYGIAPTPVIALNRAIAIGMAEGFEAGLVAIDEAAASSDLGDYYLVPAARADFLRRLGRDSEAAAEYRRALGTAPTEPEQRYLARRLEEVEANYED